VAVALIAIGALLTVAGIAVIFWPAAVVTAGVLLMAAGVDLTVRS
jgi:hypothetical protein